VNNPSRIPESNNHREYEINDLAREDAWRMFRIIGEMVIGFDRMAGIEPAITIYGSARVKPGEPLYETTVQIAQELGKLGFAIVTGGGPGLMEAANKGAHLAGAPSVGLNIQLPVEQTPNPYASLSITFNHFFARKVMLAKYATAFIAMPGGIGTLDELTEIVCLIQTHKMRPFPVILFDSGYWNGLLKWLRTTTLAGGFISEADLGLLVVCDDVSQVVKTIQEWTEKQELVIDHVLAPLKPRDHRTRAREAADHQTRKEGPE
jgi:uncharacterized protein (TIGR00730 family)